MVANSENSESTRLLSCLTQSKEKSKMKLLLVLLVLAMAGCAKPEDKGLAKTIALSKCEKSVEELWSAKTMLDADSGNEQRARSAAVVVAKVNLACEKAKAAEVLTKWHEVLRLSRTPEVMREAEKR